MALAALALVVFGAYDSYPSFRRLLTRKRSGTERQGGMKREVSIYPKHTATNLTWMFVLVSSRSTAGGGAAVRVGTPGASNSRRGARHPLPQLSNSRVLVLVKRIAMV